METGPPEAEHVLRHPDAPTGHSRRPVAPRRGLRVHRHCDAQRAAAGRRGWWRLSAQTWSYG